MFGSEENGIGSAKMKRLLTGLAAIALIALSSCVEYGPGLSPYPYNSYYSNSSGDFGGGSGGPGPGGHATNPGSLGNGG
jgi:hypothetical protein